MLNKMPVDDKVLSYFDVVLRQGDVDLLTGPNWLNDQLLAFYFEFLAREQFRDISEVLLIPGAATYLLTSSGPDIAPIVLDPLDFSSKSLVLFALNDNPDVSHPAGGSHWTLVAYTRSDNTLRHYDSCRGINSHAAKLLYGALLPVVPPKLKLIENCDDDGGGGGFCCPQQENNYDCGMMVLAIAESLFERFVASSTGTIDLKIYPKQVGARELDIKRRALHTLIMNKV
ncbi:hypothetical protein Ndes2526B_g06225 [Nannochloris sp. 'desiccata']